jgi:hypothetical protein
MTTPSEILDEAGDETEACPECGELPVKLSRSLGCDGEART